jgi:hypothetical protein
VSGVELAQNAPKEEPSMECERCGDLANARAAAAATASAETAAEGGPEPFPDQARS